jgi:hypothetical protein
VIPEVMPPDEFVDESVVEDVNGWDREEVKADAEAWAEENR